jgi:putative lipoic acid-binding regulatory protein
MLFTLAILKYFQEQMKKPIMDKEKETPSTSLNDTKSGLVFPTEFTIKVFGKADGQFEENVSNIIRRHAKELSESAIKARVSQENKYMALSITIYVESREELDAIYQDLTKCTDVLMAL